MSEKILETLMQLFAIIAKPQSNDSDRRGVVESILRRMLNQELVRSILQHMTKSLKKHVKGLKKAVRKGVKGQLQ